ncbi:hypothetical protein H8R18_08765 [Nanchangia anserum]|uniref:hypothetical protein n=1 Tax=Nanchangia anserum TaxID=2692125 RepID=UPI0018846BAD|nr:hypothetical protein [Nanchangia anserum]QOX81785.1 hypothetical protein H8R18_08765 [Nanchangia anserum]
MELRGGEIVVSIGDVAGLASCQWHFVSRLRRTLAGEPEPDPPALPAHISRLRHRFMDEVAARYRAALGVMDPEHPHGVFDASSLAPASRSVRARGEAAERAGVVVGERLRIDGVEGRVPLSVLIDEGVRVSGVAFSSHVRARLRLEVGGAAWLLARGGVDTLTSRALLTLASGRLVTLTTSRIIDDFDARLLEARDLIARAHTGVFPTWWQVSRVCGECSDCAWAIEAHDDVLAVPGIGLAQRARLLSQGVHTRRDLVTHPVDGVSTASLERVRLQVSQREEAPGPYGPRVLATCERTHRALATLPDPAPGDVYFRLRKRLSVGVDARGPYGTDLPGRRAHPCGRRTRPDRAGSVGAAGSLGAARDDGGAGVGVSRRRVAAGRRPRPRRRVALRVVVGALARAGSRPGPLPYLVA